MAKLIDLKEREYQARDPELLATLSKEQNAFLQEHLARTSGADLTFTDYEAALMQWGYAKDELNRMLKQELRTAHESYSSAADSLGSVMASYDSDWPDKTAERLPDPEREYTTYLTILTSLRHNDLPRAREQWEKKISDDAIRGVGLLRRAYGDYTSTVRETLANLNQVLMGIAFRDGSKRIRLDVHDRTRANAALTEFLSELAGLTEQAAHLNPSGDIQAQRESLFIRLDRALARIDADSKERDVLLNVNRHLVFRATVVDADDPRIENDVIDALTGTQSGGESQQISAIIAGAALRYRMNDGGEAPRFMPIILDEAFIKADADFTEQGINAWRALGFQLIVGAPEEKTESLMRTIPAMRVVTKDNELHIFSVDRASGTVNAA